MTWYFSTLVTLAMLNAPANAATTSDSRVAFADPLDRPAEISAMAIDSLLLGIARAGERLIAVGQRGHIVISDDHGDSWQQVPVPVSSDLTAVYFVNERAGWAVGHDGVVLASRDGGMNWELQLDGRRANDALVAYLEAKVAATPDSERMRSLLEEAQRFRDQGPDKPFLDVWFEDERKGFIVGAYNLIFRTEDGGATWTPWFDRTDNPRLFNLHAIRPTESGLFVVGEGGVVLKLDPDGQRFRALDVAYRGSLFGVAGHGERVLVFGLRGNAFRSEDGGTSWHKAEVGLPATIVAAAAAGDGSIALVDSGGRIVVSPDGGSFASPPVAAGVPVAGVVAIGRGGYALVGPRGALTVGSARP